MKINATLAMVLLLPFAAMAGDIHRWVDENGQVHYGDKPPATQNVETVAVKPNVYASPSVEALAADFAVSTGVVMYSAAWCGYCKQARQYFRANGISFREYDVEKNRKGRRDYKRLRAQSVPVILVGGQRLNGFNQAAFERLYSKQ